MKLRTFVIEDEAPARERLRQLLADEPDLELVGEGTGSPATLADLRRQQPDLIFLDLHIPKTDGFTLLRQAGLACTPAIVVVTAYADHAVEAFEEQVTDYVLKPVRPTRLRAAIARARHFLATRAPAAEIAPEPPKPDVPKPIARIVVRNEQQLEVIKADRVDWVAAAGNYAVIHSGRETHVLREALTSLEARLDPARFIRISRSTLVNIDLIKSVATTSEGVLVSLQDGTQLPLTRGVRELQSRLENG